MNHTPVLVISIVIIIYKELGSLIKLHVSVDILTGIVCQEPDSSPPTGGDTDRVPLNRVNEIELCRVFIWIKIPETLTDNKEVVAMQVKRVTLGTEDASVLHN